MIDRMNLTQALDACQKLQAQCEQSMRSIQAARRRPDIAQRLEVPDASHLGAIILELRKPQDQAPDPATLKLLQQMAQRIQGDYRSQHQALRGLQQDFENDHRNDQRRQMHMGRIDMQMSGHSRSSESSRASEHLDRLARKIPVQVAHAANLAYAAHQLRPPLSDIDRGPVEGAQIDNTPNQTTQIGD